MVETISKEVDEQALTMILVQVKIRADRDYLPSSTTKTYTLVG